MGKINYMFIYFNISSGLCILIRAFTIEANTNIGLYDDGSQNQFESHIAMNYIIDIANIVLCGIAICFVLRIKKGISYYALNIRQTNIIIQQPP